MRFNQVTWYSKLLALIIVIALPFGGFYLGMRYQGAVSRSGSFVTYPADKSATSSVKKSSGKTNIDIKTNQIQIKVTNTDGLVKYSGKAQLPSPCHKLKDETTVLESYPEQVQIRLKIEDPDPGTVCTQVVSEKAFSNQLKVSADAKISVFVNDKRVN